MFSFLGKFFAKFFANIINRWFQDKTNRDLGASRERERQKDAALEIRDEHAKIDSSVISAPNAYAAFLRNARKNNRNRESGVSIPNRGSNAVDPESSSSRSR